jgi:uncharacterized OsmC-like protein
MLSPIQKTIVNEVDIGALEAFVEEVKASPEQATLDFGVITRWTGQMRSESVAQPIRMGNGQVIDRNFTIQADEPEEIFGSNEAANPQELLLAALNACMTVGYVEGASLRGITLSKLEIETHGELDLRGLLQLSDMVPPGYPSIRYVVRIAGDGTPEQFAEIHAEVQKASPNYDNLARAIRMEAVLEVEGA